MKKHGLSAVAVRGLLVFVVVILFIGLGVGFYIVRGQLLSYSAEVSKTVASAKTTDSGVGSLSKLQQEVSTQQALLGKAQLLSASSSTYQLQAISDLDTYATKAGITITKYDLGDQTAATPPATTTPAAHTNGQITLTLASPLSYSQLINFIGLLEGNLPKMDVSTLSISRTKGTGQISVNTMVVEVYTQ